MNESDKGERYLKTNVGCPFCGREDAVVEGGPVDIDGPWATQKTWCLDCGKEWNAYYKLTAFHLTREDEVPKDWHTYHHPDCGTKYRGCSPDCPKDIYEKTGKWEPLKGVRR